MKLRLLSLSMLLFLSGCSLFSGGPASTMKKFMSLAESHDADGMTKLFSKRTFEALGEDHIWLNNKKFAQLVSGYKTHEITHKVEINEENISGDNAKVTFFYRNKNLKGASLRLDFLLVKENGEWKILNAADFDTPIADASKPLKSYPISSQVLYEVFNSEDDAANKRLGGKVLTLKGELVYVDIEDPNQEHKITLNLQGDATEKRNSIQCTLNNANYNDFKPNTQITIKGKVVPKEKSDIRLRLDDCSVQ